MEQQAISKYDRIKAFLMEEALKPESRLKMPTVQELMRKFGASQSPVTRAIRDLEHEGVVRCRRGSGMVSCSAAAREENFPEEMEESDTTVLFLRTDYFAESLWNMEHTILTYARQNKISIINYRMGEEADIPAIIEQVKKSRTLSGIVMNSNPGMKSEELIRYLNHLPFPVVMINSSNLYENAAENVTILSLDSGQAGRLCIEALSRAGHRKVGYIRNEPESDLTRLRFRGINAAAEEMGISVTHFPATIKAWENSAQAAEKITRARLDEIRSLGLTALIYYSGMGALAGRRVLQLAGFRIPEDISVVSEDDGSIMEQLYPACSIVVGEYLQPCRDALDIILGKIPSPGTKLYPYRYIERESVKTITPKA